MENHAISIHSGPQLFQLIVYRLINASNVSSTISARNYFMFVKKLAHRTLVEPGIYRLLSIRFDGERKKMINPSPCIFLSACVSMTANSLHGYVIAAIL